jgi:fatty acid desaturase
LASGQTDYRYLQVAVLALMVAIGWLNGLGWEFYWSCWWPGAVCLAAEADCEARTRRLL